jgi:vancomycin permeability regulator SanA
MQRRSSWLRGAKYGLGFLAVWLLVHTRCITWDGLHNSQQRADIAVILGNKVNEDGTLSECLTQRLACGLALYRAGRLGAAAGKWRAGEGSYEGDKMREYLRAQGVPDSVITVDNQGSSTQQTVRSTLRLRPKLRFRSLLAVSQLYHLSRTKMLFRQAGFAAVSGASPWYFEWRDIYSLMREFGAYYEELVLPEAAAAATITLTVAPAF